MIATNYSCRNGCMSLSGNSLSWNCPLSTNADNTPGWVGTFTNPSGSDITIESYAVLFFDSAGKETGSTTDASFPFTVAAGNSYADREYHPDLAPIPPDTATCKVTDVQTG